MNMVEREGRGSPRPYGTRNKGFGLCPRIPSAAADSIRGYFRFFPPGRRQLLLRFGEGWNRLQQQKSIMQLPGPAFKKQMGWIVSALSGVAIGYDGRAWKRLSM
jgi:hypothetical protein